MGLLSSRPRRRGVELLDDPATSDEDRSAAMRDLARSNAYFGGTSAVQRALRDTWPCLPRQATLLDVGVGMGDIPSALAATASAHGVELSTVGVDSVPYQVVLARHRMTYGVVGDARRLPFADGSADVVTCSQVLHHFFDDDPKRLIAELHRVSRDWVVVSDLRRSFLASAAFALGARALRFNVITRVDAATSIGRGFTLDELDRLVFEETGVRAAVRRSRFWRLTATWRKSSVR